MSSTSRTTSKGGKGAKADKSHKTDGGMLFLSICLVYFIQPNDLGKGGGDKTHNKENTPKIEELGIKDKVKQLMDLTCRSEDEVCLALHESNNDMTMAINLLYEEIQTVSNLFFFVGGVDFKILDKYGGYISENVVFFLSLSHCYYQTLTHISV